MHHCYSQPNSKSNRHEHFLKTFIKPEKKSFLGFLTVLRTSLKLSWLENVTWEQSCNYETHVSLLELDQTLAYYDKNLW